MLSLRIAEIRRHKGLTQHDVAQFLNITQQTYSSYETGRRQMNFETLCLLADFFEVSTDYLLGREDALPSFLDESEREMVDMYRALNDYAKDTVLNCLKFEHLRKNYKITRHAGHKNTQKN
ncbi:MAG: helix-turn-helix domain-containing protein [Defluviitaleaceae bacterium]|nr:helix-turn-helix domain-containing protein [Defluviitaleaceae bacterium]